MRRALFEAIRWCLVLVTGRGYDRSAALNNLHHKVAYRLHKLLPVFGIRGIQRIAVPGLPRGVMFLRAEDGGVAHQLIMYKQYEPFESQVVRGVLRPGITVFNIGANLGYYVLLGADCVGPSGKVIAVEPAPSNLELLRRTLQENAISNATILESAVGRKQGSARLSLSTTNSGDHQLLGAKERNAVNVSVTTVDTIALKHGVPDVIIMDVQGSELDVLLGMGEVLTNPRLTSICTEFWPKGLNDRHENGARRFLNMLTAAGFSLSIIDEKGRSIHKTTVDELLKTTIGHEERNLLCRR